MGTEIGRELLWTFYHHESYDDRSYHTPACIMIFFPLEATMTITITITIITMIYEGQRQLVLLAPVSLEIISLIAFEDHFFSLDRVMIDIRASQWLCTARRSPSNDHRASLHGLQRRRIGNPVEPDT